MQDGGMGGMGVREGSNHFSARPVSSILLHPSLPSIYLVMPVEPVRGGPGEVAQVSKQPLPLQVELDGLQQPRGQAEHQRQVKGPCPVRPAPGGFHSSALRGLRGSFL